jgi:hypothetical protein
VVPETKRTVAAVVHEQVADDIRAGWDNHLEFARENPNFYKLMWSPAVAANSTALREAFQMLHERLELGAARGQLRVSPGTAARTVMAAVTGAALSLIAQPDLFGDDTFATRAGAHAAVAHQFGRRAHAHTPCAAAPTATDIEKGERAMTTTVAPELTTW